MGRKRHGRYQIDPGDHSPELTEYLRRRLTPGRVPLKWFYDPLGGRLLGDSLHPNEAESYRTLARVLWSSAVLGTAFVVAMHLTFEPLSQSKVLLVAVSDAALVLLGVWSWRTGQRKRGTGAAAKLHS